MVRLQKFLAEAGVASRRASEQFIVLGRVTVNGQTVTELGTKIDPVRDKIAEVNRLISRLDDQQHVFYLDIGPKFLDEKGFLLPNSFRPDNLHPTAIGYEIWGQAVQAKLAELMK